MKKATEKQELLLEFISLYISANNRSPSYHEIGEAMGVSDQAAYYAVRALMRKGLLAEGKKGCRTIALPEKEANRTLSMPVRCYPSEPDAQRMPEKSSIEYVPRAILPGDCFAFTVTSESMRNAGILPGDTAVMMMTESANNDDIVLAYTDDDTEMELRRFRKTPLFEELIPENDSMGTRKAPRFHIHSKLRMVRREYK